MKLVTIQAGKVEISATRTELIELAGELLRRAEESEHEFDSDHACSSYCFLFDEARCGLEGFVFVREEEKPPQQSALERTPHAALDAG